MKLLNGLLEKLVEDHGYATNILTHTPDDLATIQLSNGKKVAYVYLVYIDKKYRLYSMSLDIIPSSIYDDLPDHTEAALSKRESSITKNIGEYLDGNISICQNKHVFFKSSYMTLDIDGVASKLKISKST